MLYVKLLSENATVPLRGSLKAAGYDLFSAQDVLIPGRGKALILTDISIAIPDDCYARIAPRSGLAWKHSIDTGAGVIDADYRGNVGVILFNHSNVDFQGTQSQLIAVSKGDRVAQMILERIYTLDVQVTQDLGATERGANGLGSTGGYKTKIQ